MDENASEHVFFALNASCSQKSPRSSIPLILSIYYITSNIPSCCHCPSKKKKKGRKKAVVVYRARERCDGGMRAVFAEPESGLPGEGSWWESLFSGLKCLKTMTTSTSPDRWWHVTPLRRPIGGGASGGSADLISCYNETAAESRRGLGAPTGAAEEQSRASLRTLWLSLGFWWPPFKIKSSEWEEEREEERDWEKPSSGRKQTCRSSSWNTGRF